MSIFTYERRSEIALVVLLSVSSLFMSLYKTSSLPDVRGIFNWIVAPLVSGISSFFSYIGDAFSHISEMSELNEKLRSLKKENFELRKKILEYRLTAVENRNLKEELKIVEEYPYLLYSEVSFRDPSNISCFITVNRGKKDGVKRGMAVVGVQGEVIGLIGRVEEVSYSTSKIILITDRNLYVSVLLENGNYLGLMHGRGANNQFCVVEYVDAQANVFQGEKVFTSGLSDVYMGGLFVGKVVGVSKSKTSFFQTVYVEPAIDMMRKFNVFIVMKTNVVSIETNAVEIATNSAGVNMSNI